ncbi:unnamed protein product [Tuber melanosporum]|uniref:(Perigord truffle) hypothetical protein n=1 Tax=Tuber melanosporum (strain Mel28) TaxID=656061 RepID=D5GPZ3_TUBMM|nr:uncharacterized protein GSTUM_00012107001 [Tuber melanosporum]CAZ86586.1 unnamed protein product [Tuber melanosporum]
MSNIGGPQTTDGECGSRITSFLPHPNPLPPTATEHCHPSGYNTFPNTPAPLIPTSPPSYNDISLPPARFKISPREEEGKEQLPAYSCSLHREAIFEQKMELSSPFDRAGVRKWGKVYAVLHGTLLKLHKPKRTPFFASRKPKGVDEWDDSGGSGDGNKIVGRRPVGYYPGELIGCYTLQLAEVGIAADYKKRHFVIRLRAQTEQFLLSAKRVEIFLDWLEALSASVDLSPSLEERSLPRYQTLPRRRRRRQPHPPTTGSTATTSAASTTTATTVPTTQAPLSPRSSTVLELMMGADLRCLLTPPQTNTPITPPAPAATIPPNIQRPQIPSEKWSPPRILTAEANIRYTRRCMAVLCGDAPRQSNYVVQDGKRYKIIWEKREMVLEKIWVDLPRYEDVVELGS